MSKKPYADVKIGVIRRGKKMGELADALGIRRSRLSCMIAGEYVPRDFRKRVNEVFRQWDSEARLQSAA